MEKVQFRSRGSAYTADRGGIRTRSETAKMFCLQECEMPVLREIRSDTPLHTAIDGEPLGTPSPSSPHYQVVSNCSGCDRLLWKMSRSASL